MTDVLALEGVSKSFGAVRVIDELSFALDDNELLGIIGPNGAGKTTLFNLISGDLRVDAGRMITRRSSWSRSSAASRQAASP